MSNLPPVLILAGGIGSRLRSVVGDVPKPLASVAGKPFLQWHIDFLAEKGIRKIVISAGYKAECFDAFLHSQKTGLPDIELVTETEQLGTGGAILYALKHSMVLAEVDSFFCLNGDSFTPWEPQVLQGNSMTYDGSMLGLQVEELTRYGTLSIDDRNKLKAFSEKTENPASNYINAGVYFFKKNLFEGRAITKCSLEYDLFPQWLKSGNTFHISKSSAKFIDIGTPESYQDAQIFFSVSK